VFLRGGDVDLTVEILRRDGVICDRRRDWVGCNFIGIVVDRERFDNIVLMCIVTKVLLMIGRQGLDVSLIR
jgi:hypothetical protein